jgi:hypothetical protein
MALDTSWRRAIVGWRALGEEEIAKKQEYADTANSAKGIQRIAPSRQQSGVNCRRQIVRIINQLVWPNVRFHERQSRGLRRVGLASDLTYDCVQQGAR